MKSKEALDKIIRKSRVHLSPPIQIAEILYHHRTGNAEVRIDPADIETYRNASKRWRDEISRNLVGRVSTSSQKFQDNLFETNAMPPKLVKELAEFNKANKGLVENYIYHRLKERLSMVFDAIKYLKSSDPTRFHLREFLDKFTKSPGLKRSIDKVYEITVYALFSTIVRALKVEVTLSIGNADVNIMKDFERFINLIVGLSKEKPSMQVSAKLFRVGVTNAADRGLDMWANFGPAIQVKHLCLSEDLAEDVSEGIAADRIVLVCLDAEKDVLERVMNQLAFSDRIQGIITLTDLAEWYEVCLAKKYRSRLGTQLLTDLEREFNAEFPVNTEMDPFLKKREYDPSRLTGKWCLT